MNNEPRKALTMPEILIVVAIIALLAAGMFIVSGKASEYAKEQLVASTLATLDTALQQYYDEYKAYPPDVNYANPGNLGNPDITMAFGASSSSFAITPSLPSYGHDGEASSIEVLYYYLNRVPQSRQVLSKLSDSDVSGKAVKFDSSSKPLASRVSDPNMVINCTINSTNIKISLFRVVDPWNMPLQYVRYRVNVNNPNTNFPLLRSAGPDRKFGTADDIVNRKN